MISLIRGVLNNALKTNEYLHLAVLTECLWMSMEAPSSLGSKIPRQVSEVGVPTKLENTSLSSHSQSIFSGLNNLQVHTIADNRYNQYFGFTEAEVQELLLFYGLLDHADAVREWYDGYRFGEVSMYCPWDVINYSYALLGSPNARPQNYWANTSGNAMVRRFIGKADRKTRGEIERLIAGESIVKTVNQELTYPELDRSVENLWSVAVLRRDGMKEILRYGIAFYKKISKVVLAE